MAAVYGCAHSQRLGKAYQSLRIVHFYSEAMSEGELRARRTWC